MSASPISTAVSYIREHVDSTPQVAVILGSGLGDFAEGLSTVTSLSTSTIPYYPVSTVQGHKGHLVFGMLQDKPILAFQGRVHFYESNNIESVLFPVRIAHELGIKTLIITNAAGGLNRTFVAGDLMILTDQINFTLHRLVQQQPTGRARIYSQKLIEKAEAAAMSNGINIRKGVYVGLKGPSYETASEVEFYARMGGDAVGMSTVFEASLAASLGMEVLGVSCITNLATGISSTKLTHSEVTEVGNRVKKKFSDLISSTISRLER